jgi:hypothetical protein
MNGRHFLTRLIDSRLFFDRLSGGGIDSDIRKAALPFVFGVYAAESTAEREARDATLAAEYERLRHQVATVKPHQFDHHKKLVGSFRVLNLDFLGIE